MASLEITDDRVKPLMLNVPSGKSAEQRQHDPHFSGVLEKGANVAYCDEAFQSNDSVRQVIDVRRTLWLHGKVSGIISIGANIETDVNVEKGGLKLVGTLRAMANKTEKPAFNLEEKPSEVNRRSLTFDLSGKRTSHDGSQTDGQN